jgi:phage antirepressor YoqD-like protein
VKGREVCLYAERLAQAGDDLGQLAPTVPNPAPAPASLPNFPSDPKSKVTTMPKPFSTLVPPSANHKPKAKALDRISTATDGALCLTNAAKILQVGPKVLSLWMQEHGWIYRRTEGGDLVAYQKRIDQGLLEHKVTRVEQGAKKETIREQVLITPKGLAALAVAFEGVAEFDSQSDFNEILEALSENSVDPKANDDDLVSIYVCVGTIRRAQALAKDVNPRSLAS